VDIYSIENIPVRHGSQSLKAKVHVKILYKFLWLEKSRQKRASMSVDTSSLWCGAVGQRPPGPGMAQAPPGGGVSGPDRYRGGVPARPLSREGGSESSSSDGLR